MKNYQQSQLLRLAQEKLQSGQLDDAQQLYNESLRKWPLLPAASFGLGVILKTKGLILKSLNHFKTALQHEPTNEVYWITYIQGLVSAGELKAAREVIEQAKSRGLADNYVIQLVNQLQATLAIKTPVSWKQLTQYLASSNFIVAIKLSRTEIVQQP